MIVAVTPILTPTLTVILTLTLEASALTLHLALTPDPNPDPNLRLTLTLTLTLSLSLALTLPLTGTLIRILTPTRRVLATRRGARAPLRDPNPRPDPVHTPHAAYTIHGRVHGATIESLRYVCHIACLTLYRARGIRRRLSRRVRAQRVC